MHWFPRFGKSMDAFRADVKKLLDAACSPKTYIVKKGDSLWSIARKELGSGAR
jgi:nucleoid-associated protein YgaU